MGDNGMARGSDLEKRAEKEWILYWIYCCGCALVRHSEANEERWYVHFAIGQGVESLANNQLKKEKLCFARYHRGLSAQA